jgi:CheY-like chemotaxis protein
LQDNLINQRMMVMLLRKLGYELLLAANGVEALDVLEREAARGPQHEIQVILMDASMDVMDGMECTRVIRRQQLPTRIRPFIIAQTANVTEEYRRMCLDAGMYVGTCTRDGSDDAAACSRVSESMWTREADATRMARI